jgi:hypothetical protein
MSSTFLSASWRRLVFLNYRVDPEVLKPYVPAHTELDIWNGTCYVSVVGFMFLNTRLKGFKIPWHVDFEEVNLRFYVRRNDPATGWKRGVVFISEIVPKPAIAWVANGIYREHYAARPMRHNWEETPETLKVEYHWRHAGRWNGIGVQVAPGPVDLKPGSEAEFITEHYWGYSQRDRRRTVEYQVDHPRWQVYPVESWFCDVDFSGVYGPAFAGLREADPLSVFLAEGSDVRVMDRKTLQD